MSSTALPLEDVERIARKALDRRFPPRSVRRLETSHRVDSDGSDAVWVEVFVDPRAKYALTGDMVLEIMGDVHRELGGAGDSRFVHFGFKTESASHAAE